MIENGGIHDQPEEEPTWRLAASTRIAMSAQRAEGIPEETALIGQERFKEFVTEFPSRSIAREFGLWTQWDLMGAQHGHNCSVEVASAFDAHAFEPPHEIGVLGVRDATLRALSGRDS